MLHDAHRHELEVGSGIPANIILERGYETITVKAEMKRRGFGDGQLNVPALLIPLRSVHGEIVGYQCKPDTPRVRQGKALKYETPSGMRMEIDVPPTARHMLGNPSIPLFVTEGVKKVDKAAAEGLCCIGLLGVWNWRGKNGDNGMTVLAAWESIALKGRTVVIVFDSDVTTKRPVLAAMRRLREFLKSRGATVRIGVLPPGPNGEKTGLDDYFVRGGTLQSLMGCVQDDLPHLDADDDSCEYEEKSGGICWLKPTNDGPQPVMLCNFTATIAREVSRDNGIDVIKVLEIEARIGNQTQTIPVPIDKFGALNWHIHHLGARAMVQPSTTSSRLVHAIQTLSDPVSVTVYTHTGWMKDGDTHFFLSGGAPIGPVGPVGPVPEIEVSLPDKLGACVLPKPPIGEGLKDAAAVVLEVIEVANTKITFPLMLAQFRAVIGNADFAIYAEGTTGLRKTAIAALFQGFFGAQFDARNLPANWSSTANSLEETCFTAKDIAVVIDDFVLGTAGERGAMDSKADRVIRGSANGSGRQRMRPDGSQRPNHPSRCLPIATGEVLPSNLSVRARMFVISFESGSVNLPMLTKLQKDAAEGRLALAMSGFIQWLAGRLDQVRSVLKQRVEELRRDLQGRGWHGRTATAVAELVSTSYVVADFLIDTGALVRSGRDGFLVDARKALIRVGEAQGQTQRDADPVDRYLQLLVACLASGRAHLCSVETGDGSPTGNELMAGWSRQDASSNGCSRWHSRGARIGWLSPGGDVFLNPDAADAAVQDLAREHGDVLMLGTSLRKRLKDRGLLRAVEMRGTEPRLLVRKTIAGVRHEGVMHLHTDTLWPASLSSTEPAQSAQSDAGGCETKSSDGPPLSEAWPNPGPVDSETGPIPTASGDAEPVAPKREATGATQAGLGRHGSLGGQPDIDEGMPEQPRRRRRAAKAGGA